MKKTTLCLVAILSLALCSGAQELIKRPTNRMAPDQCGPTNTPWGMPCNMEAADCELVLMPMFVDGAEATVIVRLVVDYSSRTATVENRVAWDVEGPQKFTAGNFDGTPARVRWYTKHPVDEAYGLVPLLDCWCEPTTGAVERCVNGTPEQ